jgi:hypothetical protein
VEIFAALLRKSAGPIMKPFIAVDLFSLGLLRRIACLNWQARRKASRRMRGDNLIDSALGLCMWLMIEDRQLWGRQRGKEIRRQLEREKLDIP